MSLPTKILQTRAALVERFPHCFVGKGKIKRPLKIGIFEDINELCPDIPKWLLAATLHDYTRGPSYLIASYIGVARIDLDGNAAGHVTVFHAEAAASDFSAIASASVRQKWMEEMAGSK